MLSQVQLFTTEIGPGCNLAAEHSRCPSADPRRWEGVDRSQFLDDDTLVECVSRAYLEFGFSGLWAVHYYNEPTLYAERLVRLAQRIRQRVPGLRMLLWTNGTVPADLTEAGEFEAIYMTAHKTVTPAFKAEYQRLVLAGSGLDDRLAPPVTPTEDDRPCLRPFTEFVLDYHGRHHPCCYDWQGAASLGNVLVDGFDTLVRRWQGLRDSVCGLRMTEASPAACRKCGKRTGVLTAFDAGTRQRAEAWRASK
jgi:MoaA/NifB/PqqE/SkfB family radical SAM enzyme